MIVAANRECARDSPPVAPASVIRAAIAVIAAFATHATINPRVTVTMFADA